MHVDAWLREDDKREAEFVVLSQHNQVIRLKMGGGKITMYLADAGDPIEFLVEVREATQKAIEFYGGA